MLVGELLCATTGCGSSWKLSGGSQFSVAVTNAVKNRHVRRAMRRSCWQGCTVRRTVPGETIELVEPQIREITGGAEILTTFAREPFEVAWDEPVVQAVLRHAGGPEVAGVPGWADSAVFAAAGIPTVVFGPGGEGAHAQVEWVDLADLERCKALYLAVARELCA